MSQSPTNKDSEWRGHWWLPATGKDTVPGVLHQDEDGSVRLELVGGFDIDVHTPIGPGSYAVSAKHDFPLILGTCGNDEFTLLDCHATHTEGGFLSRNINRQTISARRGLCGIHLSDADQAVFKSVTLSLEYLLGWLRQTTLEAKIELNDWKWTGIQSAASTPVDPLTATFGDLQIEAAVIFTQFRIEDKPRANQRRLANREWAELDIESAEPTSFTSFDGAVKALSDLMTFVAHAPAGVMYEHLWAVKEGNESEARRSRVEVMGRHIHQPRPLSDDTAPTDYLFTQADIPFQEAIPRWLALHERTWLGCGMLFGLRYIPEGYTSSRLLTVATAAEAIHRGLRPDATHLPNEQFEDMRQRVMGAFPKTTEGKKVRSFLSNYLYNEMRYKDRLLALASMPDREAVESLISDVPKWAKYLKDWRNGLAHGERPRLGPESRMVFDTLEVTFALLGLVLLNELGASGSIQRQAAAANYLSLVVTEFNKALASQRAL